MSFQDNKLRIREMALKHELKACNEMYLLNCFNEKWTDNWRNEVWNEIF